MLRLTVRVVALTVTGGEILRLLSICLFALVIMLVMLMPVMAAPVVPVAFSAYPAPVAGTHSRGAPIARIERTNTIESSRTGRH